MLSASSSSAAEHEFGLWSDKYRPQVVDELVGGAGVAKDLGNWLRNWYGRTMDETEPADHTLSMARED